MMARRAATAEITTRRRREDWRMDSDAWIPFAAIALQQIVILRACHRFAATHRHAPHWSIVYRAIVRPRWNLFDVSDCGPDDVGNFIFRWRVNQYVGLFAIAAVFIALEMTRFTYP
jgi:hypothetical protein